MKLRPALVALLATAGIIAVPPPSQAAATGSISGIVRAEARGIPDAFVVVIAIRDHGFLGKGPTPVATARTDQDGRYTVSGLPASGTSGGYWVCFNENGWPFGYYDGQCWEQADGYYAFPSGSGFQRPAYKSTRIPLLAGQNRTGINADLHRYMPAPYGGIAGRVTQYGLIPLHTVRVDAMQDGVSHGATMTASDGTYVITGLLPGEYRMCFDGSQATGGSAHGRSCRQALVTVTSGQITKGAAGVLNR